MKEKADPKESPASSPKQTVDKERREFLRKSVYAAYATPVIASLLVAQQSAAGSDNRGQCNKNGGNWLFIQRCCDYSGDGNCG